MTQRLYRLVAARATRGTTGVKPLSSNRRQSSHFMAGGLPERTPGFTPEEPIPEPTEVEDSLIEEEPEPQFGSNTSPMVESDAARAVDENLSSEQDVPPTSDEPINETER